MRCSFSLRSSTEGRGESMRLDESFEIEDARDQQAIVDFNWIFRGCIGVIYKHILGSDDVGDLRPLYVLHAQLTIPCVLVGLPSYSIPEIKLFKIVSLRHTVYYCNTIAASTPCKSNETEEYMEENDFFPVDSIE
ncbi:hypothetical protein X798_07774 [Onchocerca flexuosa]|uniref:Uncharacterized protein n=1 Tax=Onchocerca flexuosa TaxID=387005 RepID=A0A238BJQ1_9BILA|nr:hypothetical protein X798_07774 [Onchocerca flexuosa]